MLPETGSAGGMLMKTAGAMLVVLVLAVLCLSACAAPPAHMPTTAVATPQAAETPASATATPQPTPTPTPEPTATPSPSQSAAPTPAPGGPDAVGIYKRGSAGAYERLNELRTRWVKGKDICDLYAFASAEQTLKGSNYNKLFDGYWKSFPDYAAYHLGYHVRITLKSSEVIDLTIRSPKDAPKDPKKYFYQFVEVYMYDSLKPKTGPKRMHLVESAMKEDTLITSIKLTSGSKIAQVEAVTLGVFIYRDDGDFDTATGSYTGPVLYEIPVINTAGE